MNALDVLTIVRHAGGSIAVVSGKLQVKAPPGLLQAEHKAALAEGQATIVSLLMPTVAATPVVEQDAYADQERAAIQSEHLSQEPGSADFNPLPIRPAWWSDNLTDLDNQILDEFLGYGTKPPGSHEICFKCRGRGWQWSETGSGSRATCSHCKSFIGYGRRTKQEAQPCQ